MQEDKTKGSNPSLFEARDFLLAVEHPTIHLKSIKIPSQNSSVCWLKETKNTGVSVAGSL